MLAIAFGCSYSMTAEDIPIADASQVRQSPATVEVYEDPKAAIALHGRVMLNPALAQMTSQVLARHFKVVGTTDDKLGDGDADLVAVPTLKNPDKKWLHYQLRVNFVDCLTEQTISTVSVERTFEASKASTAEPTSVAMQAVALFFPPVIAVTLPAANVREGELAAGDLGDYTSLLMGDLDVALAKDQRLLAYRPAAKAKTAAKSQAKTGP